MLLLYYIIILLYKTYLNNLNNKKPFFIINYLVSSFNIITNINVFISFFI